MVRLDYIRTYPFLKPFCPGRRDNATRAQAIGVALRKKEQGLESISTLQKLTLLNDEQTGVPVNGHGTCNLIVNGRSSCGIRLRDGRLLQERRLLERPDAVVELSEDELNTLSRSTLDEGREAMYSGRSSAHVEGTVV